MNKIKKIKGIEHDFLDCCKIWVDEDTEAYSCEARKCERVLCDTHSQLVENSDVIMCEEHSLNINGIFAINV